MKSRKSLRDFMILWSTQSLSQLGSAMTGFALTLWLYEQTGSALSTAALTICTYAPYVAMSIFAGAFTDKYDKKTTMLVCDVLAAATTLLVFALYGSSRKRGERRAAQRRRTRIMAAAAAVSRLPRTPERPSSRTAS